VCVNYVLRFCVIAYLKCFGYVMNFVFCGMRMKMSLFDVVCKGLLCHYMIGRRVLVLNG